MINSSEILVNFFGALPHVSTKLLGNLKVRADVHLFPLHLLASSQRLGLPHQGLVILGFGLRSTEGSMVGSLSSLLRCGIHVARLGPLFLLGRGRTSVGSLIHGDEAF